MSANGRSSFLLTYDAAPTIEDLVIRYGFHIVWVVVKNAYHAQLITPEPLFA